MDDSTQYHEIDSPSDDTRSILSYSRCLFLRPALLLQSGLGAQWAVWHLPMVQVCPVNIEILGGFNSVSLFINSNIDTVFSFLLMYAFIGWLLHVPWLGIEPATLVYLGRCSDQLTYHLLLAPFILAPWMDGKIFRDKLGTPWTWEIRKSVISHHILLSVKCVHMVGIQE